MRYFVIINPPQFRDNSDDTQGFAWAGEAKDEAEAFELACADCEAVNGFDEGDIDREDTHTIEIGPDYKHTVEALEPVLKDLLDYEAEAFQEDTPIDLSDLCTAFGELRARLKVALGLPLVGCEADYELTPEQEV